MSFEEWWNTKDYPARCKGNCKEAYEAGLHADVHTDNSKVIAELEKENERLTVSYETLKLHDEEEIGMLKSENAKLKGIKDVATLIRANNDTVVTLMQLNNMLVSESQQLTKAKEIINQLLGCLKQDTNDPETNYYVCQYMDKAEQFLKEIEK